MERLDTMKGILRGRNGREMEFPVPMKGTDACMSWRLLDTEGVKACYVDGVFKEGFVGECGMILRPEITECRVDYMGIQNHSRYWCRPLFGNDLSQLKEQKTSKPLQSLLIREGEGWRYYQPVCDDTYKTVIRGYEGGFEFDVYSNCDRLIACENQLAFVYAEGNDPFEVMRRAAKAVAKLLGNGLRMREERRLPEVFEYLGWCSWDALRIRVSHEGLLEKAREFREKGVPVQFAIIDDMWADVPELNEVPEDVSLHDMIKTMHASKLRSFEGDPKRFPKGMGAAIADLKAAGIPKVGIWFPTTGYWSGFTADGEATELADYLSENALGQLTVNPEVDKAFALYDIFCNRIRGWGGDFVKIDHQSFHHRFENIKPIGQTARALQTALDSATGSNFDGAMINCMGMTSECMYNRRNSAVSRCSDDFAPESREWFSKNILQCAYNGLLQGQYYVNDWDMWWTDDEQATKNSVCRAISGGPVYVSDKIGRTRPEVLLPMTFADGRLLRCDESATPTADCLVGDPTVSGRIFKIRNRVGEAGVVAAFNIDNENRSVSGTVSPTDAGLDGVDCVSYEYFTGECRIVKAGERFELTLENNDVFRLYTFVPVCASGVTLLGRIDKFVGVKAVSARAFDTVTLYEGGTFGFVCEGEVKVFSEKRELPVERRGLLCAVQAEADERILRILR